MMGTFYLVPLGAAAALGLSACGGPGEPATPTPMPTIPPMTGGEEQPVDSDFPVLTKEELRALIRGSGTSSDSEGFSENLPTLEVEPTEIELRVAPGASAKADVLISREGKGAFNWDFEPVVNSPWLETFRWTRENEDHPGGFTVEVNGLELRPGTYEGRIQVSAFPAVKRSPQDVVVRMVVVPPEELPVN